MTRGFRRGVLAAACSVVVACGSGESASRDAGSRDGGEVGDGGAGACRALDVEASSPPGDAITLPIDWTVEALPCSADGWCYHRPDPSVGALEHISASGPDDFWAVSSGWLQPEPAAVLHWSGTNGTIAYPVDHNQTLDDVFAIASDDVWLVGSGSFVMHWDGTEFSSDQLSEGSWLSGVWASASDDVWAVGNFGVVGRWNGSSWSTTKLPGQPSLFDVWGSSPSNVWAVGADGAYRFNGSSWSQVPTDTNEWLMSVWTSGPNDAWMVGHGGTVLHWNGSSLTKVTDTGAWGIAENLYGTGPDDVWFSSAAGLHHFDGDSWQIVSNHRGSVHGTASDLWLVDSTFIRHFDGGEWKTALASFRADLVAAWTAEGGQLFAIAGGDGVARLADGAWTLWQLPARVSDVWGSGADDVWAAGDGIFRYDGTGWCQFGPPGYWYAIWGTGPTDVWAVNSVEIAHWDGATWSVSPAMIPLREVGGTGADEVWAVGNGVLRWDGTRWSEVAPQADQTDLRQVWASSPSDVYVVGGEGSSHFDGETWTALADAQQAEYGVPTVWGASASSVFLLGKDQLYVGAQPSWTPSELPHDSFRSAWAISGTETGPVYIVGEYGMVLEHSP